MTEFNENRSSAITTNATFHCTNVQFGVQQHRSATDGKPYWTVDAAVKPGGYPNTVLFIYDESSLRRLSSVLKVLIADMDNEGVSLTE